MCDLVFKMKHYQAAGMRSSAVSAAAWPCQEPLRPARGHHPSDVTCRPSGPHIVSLPDIVSVCDFCRTVGEIRSLDALFGMFLIRNKDERIFTCDGPFRSLYL